MCEGRRAPSGQTDSRGILLWLEGQAFGGAPEAFLDLGGHLARRPRVEASVLAQGVVTQSPHEGLDRVGSHEMQVQVDAKLREGSAKEDVVLFNCPGLDRVTPAVRG